MSAGMLFFLLKEKTEKWKERERDKQEARGVRGDEQEKKSVFSETAQLTRVLLYRSDGDRAGGRGRKRDRGKFALLLTRPPIHGETGRTMNAHTPNKRERRRRKAAEISLG